MQAEFLFHSDAFLCVCALFVEDNRNITASFLYIHLLPFLDRYDLLPGISETKLKVLWDKLVGFKPSHQRGIVRFVLFM